MVYALDRDHGKLASLKEQIAEWGLSNVEVIETAGGVSLPFDDGSLDVVLVYDVLHSDFFSDEKRQRLLHEAWRVLTRDGFLSVYPRHMDDAAALAAAEQAGFTLDRRVDTEVHHNHDLVHDTILNFKKIE
jgi:ubiquinone/menaquinone biosynthesis C-methylase UbiE